MSKGKVSTKAKLAREIIFTNKFQKDYKRELKGQHGKTLKADLGTVFGYLIKDAPLPLKYRDHALTGKWQDFRDCHIKPDLVHNYQKIGDSILSLARLGSHSELF